MAEQSTLSEHLWLLDGAADFCAQSLSMLQQSQRHIALLTRNLDMLLYGTPEFLTALSLFARANRTAQVQILIKDTKMVRTIGHPVVRLAQRLSSKILLRKMTVEPQNKAMGFMLADTDKLLYKNDEDIYRGFATYAATQEVKSLREEFNYLWQYAEIEPEFQLLHT